MFLTFLNLFGPNYLFGIIFSYSCPRRTRASERLSFSLFPEYIMLFYVSNAFVLAFEHIQVQRQLPFDPKNTPTISRGIENI